MGAVAEPGDVVRIAARAFERDRYLAALLAPHSARDGLIALAAFAGEIGRIPAVVSEPMAGEIRLQWFHDGIDDFACGKTSATGHPIIDALGRALLRHRLPAELLHAVIDAQSERLQDQPFADLAALTANLNKLEGGLFRLAQTVLASPDADLDASHEAPLLAAAAEAYGLARIVIEAPADLAQGRLLFPRDMTQAHGMTPVNARDSGATRAWQSLSRVLAERASARFAAFAEGFHRAPRHVRTATLPAALVRPYLRASERADIAALAVCDIGPLTRVWRLWLTHVTGRV